MFINRNSDSDPASDTPTTSTVDTSAVEAPENPEDAFALYDECLQDAGFGGGFVVGADDATSGAISVEEFDLGDAVEVDPQNVGIEDLDFEEFDEAMRACEGHLANVDGGFDLSPEEQAAFDDAQLEWADCMEEQGVELPDIDTNGGFAIQVEVDGDAIDPATGQPDFEAADFDFETFEAAASQCDQVFEELNSQIEGDQ